MSRESTKFGRHHVHVHSVAQYVRLFVDVDGFVFPENRGLVAGLDDGRDARDRRAIADDPSQATVARVDSSHRSRRPEYRDILRRAQMKQSMSRAGDCYDNAFMESCFGTIKTELEMTGYDSLEQALHEIRDQLLQQHPPTFSNRLPITKQLRTAPQFLEVAVSAKPGPPHLVRLLGTTVGTFFDGCIAATF